MGAKSPSEELATKAFLNNFEVIYIDNQITQETVGLKKIFKLKLGDAFILATSVTKNLLLVTRDKKDFLKNFNNVRIPYIL